MAGDVVGDGQNQACLANLSKLRAIKMFFFLDLLQFHQIDRGIYYREENPIPSRATLSVDSVEIW